MAPKVPVTPPRQIASLPQDERGYPVPAEAPWYTTGPRLAGLDPHRTAALGFLRSCTVCGFALATGTLVWRNLSQRDAALARLEESGVGVDTGMAGHLSCMLFSAFACPYWASSAGRLGKQSAVAPGARRGTRPAILGYGDIRIMVSEDEGRPFLGGTGSGATNALFMYVGLTADHPFREPTDLLDLYESAVTTDEASIDFDVVRAYWTASPADDAALTQTLDAGMRKLQSRSPSDWISYNNEDWMSFEIPL